MSTEAEFHRACCDAMLERLMSLVGSRAMLDPAKLDGTCLCKRWVVSAEKFDVCNVWPLPAWLKLWRLLTPVPSLLRYDSKTVRIALLGPGMAFNPDSEPNTVYETSR